ncbi:MAG: hypothetical protein Q3M24_08415 [Candidatus Electrothrix aestuarii]|uniref:Alpha/beta hydrolase n=1 Tax=Candidatus Electrothrix aestuarii TaxID=3062594 RepID=A0AAU8M007_9BACT|nr:hypothetical protein [Candidatus Electrothrix aestuarii]
MNDFQLYTKQFVTACKRSLQNDYRQFYDDFFEYGNSSAETALYFIPGINGVPGQIRFALPSLMKRYGTDIYVRCLNVPEFSAKNPIWEKYSLANMERKRARLISDLNALGERYKQVKIIVSSNGIYDFMFALRGLDQSLLEKSVLFWVAVAPDSFDPTPWEKFFYRLNGFQEDGHKWFAVPNSNMLKIFNPEVSVWHQWKGRGITKKWTKTDIEMRFRCFGMLWMYVSISRFNEILAYVRKDATFPITIPSYILAATADGYWQGKPQSEITKLIDRYFVDKEVLYRKASHLWVLTPDNLDDLLGLDR